MVKKLISLLLVCFIITLTSQLYGQCPIDCVAEIEVDTENIICSTSWEPDVRIIHCCSNPGPVYWNQICICNNSANPVTVKITFVGIVWGATIAPGECKPFSTYPNAYNGTCVINFAENSTAGFTCSISFNSNCL